MKKSTKLISLILSVIMAFSFVPILASAGAVPSTATTVESLIQNNNLATVVEWLVKSLNSSKNNTIGTILRLVFSFVKDENLQTVIGKQDVTSLSDAKLADILVKWINNYVLTEIELDDTVKGLLKALGVDLSNVNTVMTSLNSITTNSLVKKVGDLKYLTNTGLKSGKKVVNTTNGFTNLDIVKALFTWLSDGDDTHGQIAIIKKFVNGNLTLGKILTYDLNELVSLDDINAAVKDISGLAKSYIYLLINGNAKAGEFKKDETRGEWGTSAYKDYTADELLAAALIRICNTTLEKNEEGKVETKTPDTVISKSDCDAALKLSVYGLLAKYGPTLYTNLAIEYLNNEEYGLKSVIATINERHPSVNIYNYINEDYHFDADTFKTEFAAITKSGVLGQLNNILVKAASVMLTSSTYDGLNLKTGTNEKVLNSNLTSAFRLVLPILNTDSLEEKFGVKFDAYTTTTVKKMSLETMAAGIIKLFFPTWFADTYSTTELNKATTLEQVATLAVYYAFKGLNTSEDETVQAVVKAAGLNKITLNLANIKTQQNAYDTILGWCGKTAANAIATIPEAHYTAPTSGTYETYLNNIVTWGLKFISGLPACNTATLRAETDMYKKADIVINSLFDLQFINNCDNCGMVDVETLIFDGFLGNVLDFDLAGLLGLLSKNSSSKNFLNKTPIKAVLGIVDKLFTSLFEITLTGDYNKNGTLDVTDAHYALMCANQKKYSSKLDVNYDSSVTVVDARAILRNAIGLDPA